MTIQEAIERCNSFTTGWQKLSGDNRLAIETILAELDRLREMYRHMRRGEGDICCTPGDTEERSRWDADTERNLRGEER